MAMSYSARIVCSFHPADLPGDPAQKTALLINPPVYEWLHRRFGRTCAAGLRSSSLCISGRVLDWLADHDFEPGPGTGEGND